MQNKKVLKFLVILIFTLLLPLTSTLTFTKVENAFQENVNIQLGGVFQCEVTKLNIDPKYNYTVLTPACPSDICYIFHPYSEKCFSFKIKALKNPHIMLSRSPFLVQNDRLEVILEADQKDSYIRQINDAGSVILSNLKVTGYINDKDYSGFWIRWLDDELLEVGRESETFPFLYYRFAKKLKIDFVGILSYTTPGAWIIDLDPKCPGRNETELQKNMKTESDCFILK